MDIVIELQSGLDKITVEPASCSITRAVCNDSLQHVENSCDLKLIYAPDLFAFIIAHEQMDAVVKKRDGSVLFTGAAGANSSWADKGEPYPIDGFSLSIKDYTAKLDKQNGYEIALLDVDLASVITKLAQDCGLVALTNNIPQITLQAFVMPEGRNYKNTLDALCYQYCLSFYFDNLGCLCFFNWGDIPPSPPDLGEADMLAGIRVKKTRKRYDRVAVEYSTLTRKENEQIFFESFGYDQDDTPSPVIIQPGVFYPFDAAPEIETAEGQVYQNFAAGYAESRKKYNGELEFRRSRDTGLLHTYKHSVVRDWEGSLIIDRTEFESRRSSVRFLNTGRVDAKLRQFAIRADAVFRDKAASVTAGSGSGERQFNTEAEFIYSAVRAESLAQTLFRFFSRSGLSIDLSTDNLFIAPGSYRAVDTGVSGLTVDALVYSCTLDCDKEIFTYKAVSVGPAAVDVSRFKKAESDPPRGPPGKDGEPGGSGAPATMFIIKPSVELIVKNQNGVPTPAFISCEQYSITGAGQPKPSDKILKYITNIGEEQNYTGPLAVDARWEYIIFGLYDDDGETLLDFEDVPVLSDGAAAAMYELITSVRVIRVLENLTTDPPTISCAQQLRTGSSEPVAVNKTLVYISSEDSTKKPYTGPIEINPAWDWIEFRLYDDAAMSRLLDAERVPLLSDGKNSFVVDLQSESIAIPCDEYGDPKPDAFPIMNEAIFYAGTSRAASAVWELSDVSMIVYQGQIILFLGSGTDIFSPLTAGCFPVSEKTIQRLHKAEITARVPSGVTINSFGVIKIERSLDYANVNTIIVRGIYNGIIRESVLTITKVLDGVAPVTINLVPDAETIEYYYDGSVYSGQLPLVKKATLYKGTVEINNLTWRNEPLTWSLSGAPSGVTIDGSGNITVAANAALADKTTITVNAVFEGKTYKKAFTINKVFDGAPSTIYKLFPSTTSVSRDAAGVAVPGSISCTVMKTTGANQPVADTSKAVRYVTSADGSASSGTAYTHGTGVTIPTARTGGLTWIEFRLYDNNAVIDSVRVQIVQGGQDAPRYLGKTYSVGTNTGVVQIYGPNGTRPVQANIGDYVTFVDVDEPGSSPWKAGAVLRFTGSGWEPIDPTKSENDAFFVTAMKDILESGASNAFIVAFIGKLFAQRIVMTPPGIIESAGFAGVNGGVNGYRFTAQNGLLEAIGAKLRNLTVDSGVFRNVTVTGHIEANTGYFRGSVELGMPDAIYPGVTPLIGGIRAWVYGYKWSSTVVWQKSSNIRAIRKIATGRYEIEMNAIYSGQGQGVSADGWQSAEYDSYFTLWYRNPLRIELSHEYWDSHAGGPADGYFVAVEFKNSSGTLVDPQVANIRFLS